MRDAHFSKWISFDGRIGRAEYWLSYMLPSALVLLMSLRGADETGEVGILLVGGLTAAFLFTLGLVKRFRDLEWPGFASLAAMGAWWGLLAFLGLSVFGFVVIVSLFQGFFAGITNGQWSPNVLPDLDGVIRVFVALVAIPILAAGFGSGASATESEDRPPFVDVAKGAAVRVLVLGLAGYGAWYFLVREHPIIQALESGQVEPVRAALERGANPDQRARGNTVIRKGTSALEFASERGLHDIADALLEYGADGSGKPLLTAIRYGNSAMVALMLAHGTDPNASIPREIYQGNEQPLWRAVDNMLVRKDGVNIVRLLIENGAADPKAFVRLIQRGEVELVEAGLDHGAGVNAVYTYTEAGEEGWWVYETTPLMTALRSIGMSAQGLYVNQEQADMLTLLVGRGADPRLPVGGVSPLMWLEDLPAEATRSRDYRALVQLLRAPD